MNNNFRNFIWMGVGAAFGFVTAKYMTANGFSFKGIKTNNDTADTNVDYLKEEDIPEIEESDDDLNEELERAKKIAEDITNKMNRELGIKFIKPIKFKDKTTAYRVAALAMWEIEQNTCITVGQLGRMAKEEGIDISDMYSDMEDYGWTSMDEIEPYYSEPDDAWLITNNCPIRIATRHED